MSRVEIAPLSLELERSAHRACPPHAERVFAPVRLTVRGDALGETVLKGLKDNLLQPELIHEFVTAYQQQYNGLLLRCA